MKKIVFSIALVLLGLALVWYIFIHSPAKFDTKPYEAKIDSLQQDIDSIHLINDTLELGISVLERDNDYLSGKIVNLNDKVKDLKGDLKEAKAALQYTPTQVDSFFVAKYEEEYTKVSSDTTYLPIEVSKAVVVDLKEGEVNEKVVIIQDSVIQTQASSIQNRDQVIVTLRQKETNYQSIIQKQIEQGENYKIQIGGLKEDIKKNDRRLKMGKIQKFVLGALVIGLAVTHK
jgi:septal ring factor EnvC (AmiA/AmiB activator)